MSVRSLLPALVLLTALPAAAQEAAVLLLAPALDEDAAYALETKLRDEAAKKLSLPLRQRADTRALFAGALAAGLECHTGELACLAQTGAVVGVERLVYARAVAWGEGHLLQLSLVDVKASALERQVEVRLPPGRLMAEEPIALRRLLRALFTPAAVGALHVQASPAASRVFVDGEEVDPASPVPGLLPGVRQVRVTGEGFLESVHEVVVVAAETTLVPVTLSPLVGDEEPPAKGPNVVLLAAGGVGVGLGVVVGVGGYAATYFLAQSATRGLAKGTTDEEAQAAVSTARLYGTLGLVAVGVGAALVVAGAGALAAGLLLEGE